MIGSGYGRLQGSQWATIHQRVYLPPHAWAERQVGKWAWKNILDMRRAVDYLCARPEVKKDRIGCYGHSMGSTHTWLVGPWEPRITCLVGNCCLPTYAAIHRTHILTLLPELHPGLVPARRHARHRRPDRPTPPAPEFRRDGFGQPDRRGARRREDDCLGLRGCGGIGTVHALHRAGRGPRAVRRDVGPGPGMLRDDAARLSKRRETCGCDHGSSRS